MTQRYARIRATHLQAGELVQFIILASDQHHLQKRPALVEN